MWKNAFRNPQSVLYHFDGKHIKATIEYKRDGLIQRYTAIYKHLQMTTQYQERFKSLEQATRWIEQNDQPPAVPAQTGAYA